MKRRVGPDGLWGRYRGGERPTRPRRAFIALLLGLSLHPRATLVLRGTASGTSLSLRPGVRLIQGARHTHRL